MRGIGDLAAVWLLVAACATVEERVVNTPPGVSLVAPESVASTAEITVEVHTTDLDGDLVEVMSYAWTRNGIAMPHDVPRIGAEDLIKGDTWEVTVVVSDGLDEASATASIAVTNAPPYVLGARIDPSPVYDRQSPHFAYDQAVDPDRDETTVTWEWMIDGVVVASDRDLGPEETRAGDVLQLFYTVSDGTDSTTEVLQRTIREDPPAAKVIVALDITGSFYNELPMAAAGTGAIIEAIAGLEGPDDAVGMVVFNYNYAALWTPLTTVHGDAGVVTELATSWATIRHASRIAGSDPDPSDPGPRPHMPREYNYEQGTDHSVPLAFAREVLTRDASPGDYRAIVLITDGQPLNLRVSDVRDRIGYVETRWEMYEGPLPHTVDEIKISSVATARAAWNEDGIHIWVLSLREQNDFCRNVVQGDGEFLHTLDPGELVEMLQQVADALPTFVLE